MFLRFVLVFIVSVLLFYQQAESPPLWFGLVTLCLAVGLIWVVRSEQLLSTLQRLPFEYQAKSSMLLNSLLGLIIGISWVFWQTFFTPTIPERALNQPVWLVGTLIELPNQSLSKHRVRIKYKIKVDEISLDSSPAYPPVVSYAGQPKPIVSINWYVSRNALLTEHALPQLGERWRFRVKLKANHFTLNPSGFDYEAWLLQQGISATGYIKALTRKEKRLQDDPMLVMQKISEASALSLFAWRNTLATRLNTVFDKSEYASFYRALTFGDKSDIASEDWILLQNTGTIHLMVISGLHMGIIAFLGFWFFKQVWRWVGYRQTAMDLPKFAALGGLLFATLYLMVSGFSIPTQRAWLMVVAVLGFVLLRRTFQPWSALALAALLIVLLDTTSVLSFGFWLSFIAVALIFLALKSPLIKPPDLPVSIDGTVEKATRSQRWFHGFKTLLWLQLILTLGLAPFLIWAFHSLPVYSFIANMIAVPFISFLGLPWLFLSSVIGLISVEGGQWMIGLLDMAWHPFWQFLQWVNQLPFHTVAFAERSIFWLLAIYALLFFGLRLKKTWPQAGVLLLVFIWMMSLSMEGLNGVSRPEVNQAKLTVLDVGQAQAIVIETQHHVVLYDLGGKWGDTMDGTKLAIQPYLTAQGWSNVDLLIVSHSDMDHAGGLQRLLTLFSVRQAVSGQPKVLNKRIAKEGFFTLCKAGQSWEFDGVVFEMLSPRPDWMASTLTSDNDLSCVLTITIGGEKILITGDLSQKGEVLLLDEYRAESLQADLLIAGHHGSKSSSATDFLQAVSPTKIVFSAGYLNRFNFPSPAVIERIEKINEQGVQPAIHWWNTACSGALTFEISSEGIKAPLESRKIRRKWYHHRCLDLQQGVLFQ
ncbi:MAG: DNA internalization-related competence protein ComEC/Rec2 [Thiomicrorhabdus sp.]|nr:DNA internalization-related competence protein ComEC/Rec2 [Thiomicrorhabdus sp.]